MTISSIKKSPLVGVLILTWNGKDLVLDCVKSVLQCAYPNFQIMVVDNASNDGTMEALRQEFGESIEVIANPHNYLFAGGNNVGIRRFMEMGVDWVLLLNNDVEVDPAFIDELIKVGESDRRIGIVGPKIYYWEPRDQIWFAGGKMSLFGRGSKHIGIRQSDRGQFNRIRDVDYITGCAMMIRRTVIEKIGLLDESYPMYNEDSDWCFRAKKAGYRVVYVPESNVWHKISTSAGGQLSAFKIRHRLRSQWVFMVKYASWYHWLCWPFGFMVEVIRILILLIAGKFRTPSTS